MRRGSIALALAAALVPAAAGAATDTEDFKVRSAQDLVDLCSHADGKDALHDDAVNFCHGFVSGAWQYHQASTMGPRGAPIVCPPEPPPTRTDVVGMFVAWAGQNAKYMSESAVDVLFRFLTEKYPCAEPAAVKKKGGAK